MQLAPEVRYIIDTLYSAGYRADVVGGAVRDHLLGRPSFDYDITTAATPEEVKATFASHKTVDTGIKHGTVTLVLECGNYEITTWRVDGDYLDNRHPDSVTFTRTLSEDLARRDFTVNAICYNPRDGYTDLFGGMDDLRAGVIRAVGEPHRRFTEDALRIMRAVRFSASLGFMLDADTAAAATELRALLRNVSAERIYAELKRLIAADGAYDTLLSYPEIILTVLPELSEIKLPERERFSACGYAARLLSLFALGSAAPRDAFSAAMHRLKTDADIRTLGERALELVGAHTPSDRYTALKLLSAYSVREAELAIELGVLTGIYGKAEQSALADALASGIAYRVSALNIGGRELMALGIFGKRVGEVLSELLDAVMRGECENTAEALLLRAKGFLGR